MAKAHHIPFLSEGVGLMRVAQVRAGSGHTQDLILGLKASLLSPGWSVEQLELQEQSVQQICGP